jgi:hypothetical protein
MIELPDGQLVVGGAAGTQPLVVRLIAGGAVDPTFDAGELAGTGMTGVTTVAADPNGGRILAAGYGASGVPGAMVARLQADGSPDPRFGEKGSSWIDLSTSPYPIIGAMTVLPNSDVLVAGGSGYYFAEPFLVRLTHSANNDGPGVIGIKTLSVSTGEAQDAVVTVRRVGGNAGAVSIAYRTRPFGSDVYSARENDDFEPTSGRLDWSDGDGDDKEIRIRITPDDGPPEEVESFSLELRDPDGGAGIGTRETSVSIDSDSPAAGMFAIEYTDDVVGEDSSIATVWVSRGYSYAGEVSVDVVPVSDTATSGEDFDGSPVTVTWADGDSDWKAAEIPIIDDSEEETQERFTLQLSDPTGGAVIGPRSTGTLEIGPNDQPPPPPPPPPDDGDGGGGGGSGGTSGVLSLLLIGAARLLRRATAGVPIGKRG